MDYRHLWVASNKELSTVWKTTNSDRIKGRGVSTNVLSGLWSNEVHDAVLGLRKDGFYVMKTNISEELIASLRNNLSPKYVTPSGVKSGLIQQKYTELATKASHVWGDKCYEFTKWSFDEADLRIDTIIRMLSTDSSLWQIASTYLGTSSPYLLNPYCWISKGRKGLSMAEQSSAAQLYHIDYDSFNFLKVMIYLSDVGIGEGPHCYIRGSQASFPSRYYQLNKNAYERLTDNEVYSVYGDTEERKFYGGVGSVILVDTSGFHKGDVLNHLKQRWLLQLEFVDEVIRFGREFFGSGGELSL